MLDMKETIGDRLKQLRGSMPQPEFAKIAGTTKQYVWRLENGHNDRPNPDFIQAWAGHFGVRMEWITSGKPPKEAPVAAPSHPAGLDLDILRVALIALREAADAEEKEIDLYKSAPIIAFAYRERAAMKVKPTPAQLAEFDQAIRKRLREGQRDGEWTGRATGDGTGSVQGDAPKAAKARRGKG